MSRWLISLLPSHRVYVDPFGGAASLLMQKERSYAEVYNDKWDAVVNVFQCLRDPKSSEQLKNDLHLTPFSRSEFNSAFGHTPKHRADVEAARLCILRSFAGFGSASTNGEYATGFRCNSNRSGTTPAHDWANYPAEIEFFCERLRGVVIENKDAVEVIQQHDGLQTLFYVDPPYPHSTRNMARGNAAYTHEMSDEDHRRLAQTLRAVRGMVILSGYHCDLYDTDLYGDWHSLERSTHADGARDRVEVVWMNEAAWNARPQKFLVELA